MWQSIHQLDQVRSVSNSSTTFDAFCICLQIPGPSHPNSSCTGRPPTQRTVVLRPECKPQLGLDNTMKVPLIPHRFQKVTKYLLFFTSVLRLIRNKGRVKHAFPTMVKTRCVYIILEWMLKSIGSMRLHARKTRVSNYQISMYMWQVDVRVIVILFFKI